MKDFNITIRNVTANTDMIEEDVIRMEMGLNRKEQDYNRVIDTYGNKVFKIGLGHYFNARYEIWENNALRAHYSDKEIAMKDWERINETEPPIREQERIFYMDL